RVTTGLRDLRQRPLEQLPGPGRIAALAVEGTQIVEEEQLLLGRLALLPQLLPGLERAVPVARQIAGGAEIVPGDRLLALVPERAVELQRAPRLASRSVILHQVPVRRAETGSRVGFRPAVAAAPGDEDRGPLLGEGAASIASMPGAGAEQVVEPRGRLGIAARS